MRNLLQKATGPKGGNSMKPALQIVAAFVTILLLSAANATGETDHKDKVDSYLGVATKLIEMEIYDKALEILRKAEELDPSRIRTRELMRQVNSRLNDREGPVKAKSISKQDLEKILTEINFTDAKLDEVVDYLARLCDVNIVIDKQAQEMLTPKPAPPSFDNYGELIETDAEIEPVPVDTGGITIRLKNVPLKAVLKYVLRTKGLTYIVEDYAIVIVPIGYVPPEEMETVIFHLYGSGESVRRYLTDD